MKSNYRIRKGLQTNLLLEYLKKIVALRSEYNLILAKKNSKQLNQNKQHHFELSEKPHKHLARQFRPSQASRAIHII